MDLNDSNQIIEVSSADWNGRLTDAHVPLLAALEQGKVLYFPHLTFALEAHERRLLDTSIADPKRKNISRDSDGRLHGVTSDAATQTAVQTMLARYARLVASLVDGLFPEYRGKLRAAPTSLRPQRVEGRVTSWRKDDSRLHVDAFPSRPNHGERILRVFTNVHPAGVPRVWRVGEPFEAMARRFLPKVPRQWPGSAAVLKALAITKQKRSEYDHIMLHLHDLMKADLDYQKNCPQEAIPFPPGSVWVCFSDQTSHAVMSGQFMLEQTFFLPVTGMAKPDEAPLRVLQRLTGRQLI